MLLVADSNRRRLRPSSPSTSSLGGKRKGEEKEGKWGANRGRLCSCCLQRNHIKATAEAKGESKEHRTLSALFDGSYTTLALAHPSNSVTRMRKRRLQPSIPPTHHAPPNNIEHSTSALLLLLLLLLLLHVESGTLEIDKGWAGAGHCKEGWSVRPCLLFFPFFFAGSRCLRSLFFPGKQHSTIRFSSPFLLSTLFSVGREKPLEKRENMDSESKGSHSVADK